MLDGTVQEVDGGTAVLRLDSGIALRGAYAGALGAGARASALLRPERITLAPAAAASGTSQLRAVVADSLYLGHTVKYTVELDIGQRLIVHMPNAAAGMPARGDAVALGIAEHGVWIMPVDGAKRAGAR
jgi:hypothetical protein